MIAVSMSFVAMSQVEAPDEVVSQENITTGRYLVGEELIFTLYIDNIRLGDYFVIVTETGYAVDFESLILALDFPISSRGLVYEGWFIDTDNTFYLNLKDSTEEGFTARVAGDDVRLKASSVTENFGAIYIDVSAVELLFPISIAFDEANLEATMTSSVLLPIQEKLKRGQAALASTAERNVSKYPELKRYYELLSAQALDARISTSYSESSDTFSDGYSILGAREIAYVNSRFFLSGSYDNPVRAANLTLSRNFSEDAFKADISRIEVGDINPVQIGGQGFRGGALGLVLTNQLNNRELNDQQATTISGDVQVGWDVELYRNGVLIDRKLNIESGRYDFEDIQLFTGENNFRVVLYGPQGQEVTRSYDRFVDNDNRDSSLRYRSSITRLGSSLFNTNDATSTSDGIYDWSTVINKGITDSLSANAGWRIQNSGDAQNAFSLGIDSKLTDRIALNANTLFDGDNSQLSRIGIRGQYKGHAASLTLTENKRDEATTRSLGLANRGAFRLSDAISMSYQNQLGVSVLGSSSGYSWQNNVALISPLGTINHDIRISTSEAAEDEQADSTSSTKIEGGLNVRRRLGHVSFRGGLGYSNLNDEFSIDGYSADLSYSFSSNLSSRLSLSYATEEERLFTELNLGYQTNNYIFSANATHTDDTGVSLGLSARVSLGGEPFTRDIFYTADPLSASGSAIVRVFIDANANAVFDIGEEVLEGVKVESMQSRYIAYTDKNGLAHLKRLNTFRKTDIKLDRSTIEEPFLSPIIEGVSILPRSGFIDSIDYPLIRVSEIEGFVQYNHPDLNNHIPPLTLHLINQSTNEVLQTRTEFDGYYYFAEIRPGKYLLQIDAADLQKLYIRDIEPVPITISASGSFETVPTITMIERRAYRGFTSRIATFSSLRLLKAYYSSLKTLNAANIDQQRAFFTESEDGYHLNLGFYADNISAENICDEWRLLNMACEVQAHIERRN